MPVKLFNQIKVEACMAQVDAHAEMWRLLALGLQAGVSETSDIKCCCALLGIDRRSDFLNRV